MWPVRICILFNTWNELCYSPHNECCVSTFWDYRQREAHHSSHFSARLRKNEAIPPLPQYVFIAWCLVKYRDNSTLTFTLRLSWWWRHKLWSSGLWRGVVVWEDTNISVDHNEGEHEVSMVLHCVIVQKTMTLCKSSGCEELAASIFTLKRWYPMSLCGVTTQKTVFVKYLLRFTSW